MTDLLGYSAEQANRAEWWEERIHPDALHGSHAGAAALEIGERFHPDVIVLDIGLPGMDGYELARRMRDKPGTATSLLIALTGYGQSDDYRRSRETGFDHHLLEPVDLRAVRQILGHGKAL